MSVGTVTLTFADASSRNVSFANARASRGAYDRQLFRAPYGSVWYTAGTSVREPEMVAFTFEVWSASGINTAAALVGELLEDLHAAVTVTLPWGSFTNAGVLSITQAPIASGYRVDALMATEAGVVMT